MNEQTRLSPARDWIVAFTALDFERMMRLGAFDDMRVELVSGDLEKMMPALPAHGERNFAVGMRLFQALGSEFRIGTDIAIRIDAITVRAADIAVYPASLAGDRLPDGSEILLAVEIADTMLSRDLGAKVTDYARAGVQNYWVVDATARVVHVMRERRADGFAVREIVRFGEPLILIEQRGPITID